MANQDTKSELLSMVDKLKRIIEENNEYYLFCVFSEKKCKTHYLEDTEGTTHFNFNSFLEYSFEDKINSILFINNVIALAKTHEKSIFEKMGMTEEEITKIKDVFCVL